MAKKKVTIQDIQERVNVRVLETINDSISDFYPEHDEIQELMAGLVLPLAEDLIKKEIVPRVKKMSKDEKFLDKMAKELLLKKLSK